MIISSSVKQGLKQEISFNVDPAGLEPAISSLQMRRSTTELRAHAKGHIKIQCAWKESNLRPLSYQDSVLPLNYTRV